MASEEDNEYALLIHVDGSLRAVRDGLSPSGLFSFLRTSKERMVMEGDLLCRPRPTDQTIGQGILPSTPASNVQFRLMEEPQFIVPCSLSHVVPLSAKLAYLLRGVSTCTRRAAIRGQDLTWLGQLKVGDRVMVLHPQQEGLLVPGVVKYIGATDVSQKTSYSFGIELETSTVRQGWPDVSDGVLHGKRFFSCSPGCGVFVPADRICPLPATTTSVDAHVSDSFSLLQRSPHNHMLTTASSRIQQFTPEPHLQELSPYHSRHRSSSVGKRTAGLPQTVVDKVQQDSVRQSADSASSTLQSLPASSDESHIRTGLRVGAFSDNGGTEFGTVRWLGYANVEGVTIPEQVAGVEMDEPVNLVAFAEISMNNRLSDGDRLMPHTDPGRRLFCYVAVLLPETVLRPTAMEEFQLKSCTLSEQPLAERVGARMSDFRSATPSTQASTSCNILSRNLAESRSAMVTESALQRGFGSSYLPEPTLVNKTKAAGPPTVAHPFEVSSSQSSRSSLPGKSRPTDATTGCASSSSSETAQLAGSFDRPVSHKSSHACPGLAMSSYPTQINSKPVVEATDFQQQLGEVRKAHKAVYEHRMSSQSAKTPADVSNFELCPHSALGLNFGQTQKEKQTTTQPNSAAVSTSVSSHKTPMTHSSVMKVQNHHSLWEMSGGSSLLENPPAALPAGHAPTFEASPHAQSTGRRNTSSNISSDRGEISANNHTRAAQQALLAPTPLEVRGQTADNFSLAPSLLPAPQHSREQQWNDCLSNSVTQKTTKDEFRTLGLDRANTTSFLTSLEPQAYNSPGPLSMHHQNEECFGQQQQLTTNGLSSDFFQDDILEEPGLVLSPHCDMFEETEAADCMDTQFKVDAKDMHGDILMSNGEDVLLPYSSGSSDCSDEANDTGRDADGRGEPEPSVTGLSENERKLQKVVEQLRKENAALRKKEKKARSNESAHQGKRGGKQDLESFFVSRSSGKRSNAKLVMPGVPTQKPTEAPRGRIAKVFPPSAKTAAYSGYIQPHDTVIHEKHEGDRSRKKNCHTTKNAVRPAQVKFFEERVVSSGLMLQHGDEVQYVPFRDRKQGKNDGQAQGPKASRVSIVECRRTPEEFAEFVARQWLALNAVLKDSSQRNQVIRKLTESLPVWKAVFNCRLPNTCVPSVLHLITALASQASSLKERCHAVIRVLIESSFFKDSLWSFLNETYWYAHEDEVRSVMQFLVAVARVMRHNSRQLLPIVQMLHEKKRHHIGEQLQQLMIDLLKVCTSAGDDCRYMEYWELPLVPSDSEMFAATSHEQEHAGLALQPVRSKGPYESVQAYVDTYFRLLREDCFALLKKNLNKLLYGELDLRDMKVYEGVQLVGLQLLQGSSASGDGSGLALALRVHPCSPVRSWATCSNLMFGNLLSISTGGAAGFRQPIWATVHQRDEKLLASQGVVLVELCSECNTLTVGEVVAALVQAGNCSVMVESPTYYKAYQPVLRALQMKNVSCLPFQEELVTCRATERAPDFITSTSSVDSSIILNTPEYGDMLVDDLVDILHQPDIERVTTLDNYQRQAIAHSLKNQIALVQGPPGTGKTFLGIKIVRLLLSLGCPTPILVLTYKNHALDEFLVDCLEHYPAEVVRVGGRSKDHPELDKCNLNELRRSSRNTRRRQRSAVDLEGQLAFSEVRQELDELKPHVQLKAKELSTTRKFSAACFLQQATEEQIESLLRGGCESLFTPARKKRRRKKKPVTEDDASGSLDSLLMQAQANMPLKDFLTTSQDDQDSWPESQKALRRKLDNITSECLALWLPRLSLFHECQVALKQNADMLAMQVKVAKKKVEERRKAKAKAKKNVDSDEDIDVEEEEFERLAAAMRSRGTETRLDDFVSMEDKSKAGVSIFAQTDNWLSETQETMLLGQSDLWQLSDIDRVKLTQLFLQRQTKEAAREFADQLEEYSAASRRLAELQDLEKVELMKDAMVVGMTITGASIHQALLQLLQPAVVIVEEAAEVLEPQLISVLGEWVKQLVLIGDHRQLRPSVESYKLVTDYHFDISMMERLLNNNLPHIALRMQNRMREEFVPLLHDIYPHLHSNISRVQQNMKPTCVAKTMFFWEHYHAEQHERSYANEGEADMVVQLALFFLQQGYAPNKVTVLSPYQGQVSVLRRKLRPHFTPPNATPKAQEKHAKPRVVDEKPPPKVAVHTIDRFQGDENDIIIVSLVRSNDDHKLGFVKILNRRCVAQSRARCGMFFVGNASTIGSDPNWRKLIGKMEAAGCTGRKIPLCCPKHPRTVWNVEHAHDLDLTKSFCRVVCNTTMPCSLHSCQLPCQPRHSHAKCTEKVQFMFAQCGHMGQRQCWQSEASLVCQTNVHFTCKRCRSPAMRACSVPEERYTCRQTVIFTFNKCNHQGRKLCFESEDSVLCTLPCTRKLPCSHVCTLLCGEDCNPNNCPPCEIIRKEKLRQEEKLAAQKRDKAKADARREVEKLKASPLKGPFRIELNKHGDTAAEYYNVYDQVVKYIQPGHNWYPKVTKVERVECTKLDINFNEVRQTLFDPSRPPDRKFHGTSKDGVEGIIKEGFRMPSQPGMYGTGIYFATDSSKSAQEIYTKGSNMLLICDVLLGKTWTVDSGNHKKGLDRGAMRKNGYDSLFAKRGTRDTGGVLYDEFVVYDPRQARPKYIVHYTKTGLDQTTRDLLMQQAMIGQKLVRYELTPSRQVDLTDPKDIQFRVAESQFLRLMQRTGQSQQLKRVSYVINPPLVAKFDQKQQAFRKKYGMASKEGDYILAFHGTALKNIDSILQTNLQISKLSSNTGDRGYYGAGLYFSEFPAVSIGYAGGAKALLLCKVLPGKTYPCTQLMVGASLMAGYDSHGAQPDKDGRNQELVIFDSDQILPCYVLHF